MSFAGTTLPASLNSKLLSVEFCAVSASMRAAVSFGLVIGDSAAMYFGLLRIPAHRLFSVTSWLITLLAAGMASQAVLFLQNAGYLQFWMMPLWDTSWLLTDDSIAGRVLHTLVGYTDQPDGLQLAAYIATIAAVTTLSRLVNRPRPVRAMAPAE